jgi:hypothetical protein
VDEEPADPAGRTVGTRSWAASYIGYAAMMSANGLPLTRRRPGHRFTREAPRRQIEAAVYANNEPIVLARQGFPVNVMRLMTSLGV